MSSLLIIIKVTIVLVIVKTGACVRHLGEVWLLLLEKCLPGMFDSLQHLIHEQSVTPNAVEEAIIYQVGYASILGLVG